MNGIGRIFRIISILMLVCATYPLSALADDWIAVPPEDLAMKDNPKQPGADAMVLYREVNVDAKNSTVNNYLRIKIFTPAGVKAQSDVEIQYDKAQESIQGIKARTIRPDGSIAEFDGKTFDKEIVKGSGIKYLAKTFTMPDVQPGSIIEYKYREQYDDRYYQNLGWIVQYDLYTRLARFSIKPDESMSALPLLSRAYLLLAGNTNPQKQANGLYTLEIRDLAGLEMEPLMPAPSALRARVDFYYKNSDEPETETPDQYWKRIGKKWSSYVDHFVDKKNALAAEVSQDVTAGDPPETKLRKLYARAAKIRNLDIEDDKTEKEAKQEQIKPNNNVEDVLKHGYGTSFDINLLFLGLARAAGFEAADLRVAPRSGMYFFPQREAARDLGAELVWVRADSKEYYLDPAAHYYPFGVLPWYEVSANGVRVSKDGSEMILTAPSPSTNATIVRHVDVTVDSNMDTSGKIQVDFSGQEAATRRYDNRNDDEAGRKKALGDEIKGWLPGGATVEVTGIANWEDMEKPIHVEGTLKIPSFASTAAQRMLMPLDFFQTSELGYFQSQKRVNEVDFSYAYEKVDDLVIHMPAGYKAQAVPDPQKVSPGPVSYEISAAPQPDGLKVTRHLVINGIRYPKESYPALRSFFSIAKTNDNAQVMFQADRSAKNN
ncbi:MAG: DUF3857 and transglutaminase domain-containing protein [Acidobacteriia bacterium]|nr:DUF3857 and transglutaminase domain-containing protein [Terriglobia bacterium]